ncbi:MAG TPA: hypothetical protein VJC16_04385 [Candidatus Nanoarchaeia archaeon]|nr:hypothetical protein [Candidatus Nanoarchaeia archaeon]
MPDDVIDQKRVFYDYPASIGYIALGEYMKQAYGNNLRDKVLVDAGCGLGAGVLYLREQCGIDARGIEDGDVVSAVKNNTDIPYRKELQRLIDDGVVIKDRYEFMARHFEPDSVDTISFVYWGWGIGNPLHDTNREEVMLARQLLPGIVKHRGFVFEVLNDGGGIHHPFITRSLLDTPGVCPTHIQTHMRYTAGDGFFND